MNRRAFLLLLPALTQLPAVSLQPARTWGEPIYYSNRQFVTVMALRSDGTWFYAHGRTQLDARRYLETFLHCDCVLGYQCPMHTGDW